MKRSLLKKTFCGLLSAALVLTSAAVPGFVSYAASTPKDVKGHWAQKYIEKAIDAGIVKGYTDGTFRPENSVTRAEFSHMINAALGNTSTATASFKDVKSTDWYYSDVTKALAAGYASGYSDSTFRPNQSITRMEAAVMLSRIVPTAGNSKSLSSYPDYKKVASWGEPALQRIMGKGYMSTYADGKIHPTEKMTRAQAATAIANILDKETIVKTAPTVTSSGSKLSQSIYSNGVIVGSGLGSYDATINNCVVLGNLNVQGGGTITVSNSRVAQAIVQKSASSVTLALSGETSVKNTSAANTAVLQVGSLSGGSTYGASFESVSVVKNADISLSGTFPKVSVDGASADVSLNSGTIANLIIGSSAAGGDITAAASSGIILATVNGTAYFHGQGTVTKMIANANGITYEKKPGTVTVSSGVTKAPVLTEASLAISTSPKNDADDVNIDTAIKITFSDALKLAGGSTLTSSNVYDIVELRLRTSAGSKVDYTASVDSSKKVITITPDSNLRSNTLYYIGIAKGKLADSKGNTNDALISSFTTGSTAGGDTTVSDYMTFTPKSGATNVSTTVEPKIRFTESMICYDGTSIKNSDLEDIITFRKGSSGGSSVPFTAAISSDKETITITPEKDLFENTKYYLAIESKMIKTASKETAVPGCSILWTTGSDSDDTGGDYMTFTPKNKKTSVALNVTPTIKFSEKMMCYDGSTLSNSDLSGIVIFREEDSKGDDVDFSASINSAKTEITVTPSDDLKKSTKYYLAIDSKSLRTAEDEKAVSGDSVTWTTGSSNSDSDSDFVKFSPRDGKSDVDRYVEPTITFSEAMDYYDGDSIRSGESSDLEDCITLEDEDGDDVSFTASYNKSDWEITITPAKRLASDTEYTLSVRRRSFQTRSDEEVVPACSVIWTTE